ncbi:insulin-like growth factor-binding protein 6 isoform X2 [Triticum dicoccoides]|uniref:insulin-like growth factor-binding protein 6 isoform X2 n=1 Tax=Triticum dicoccoides TaxID=85692 RepID=UPI001891B4F4|nr:insulin-like growth factor-binding protein 6 isoform X2 [Triticum dicoccoides]
MDLFVSPEGDSEKSHGQMEGAAVARPIESQASISVAEGDIRRAGDLCRLPTPPPPRESPPPFPLAAAAGGRGRALPARRPAVRRWRPSFFTRRWTPARMSGPGGGALRPAAFRRGSGRRRCGGVAPWWR